MTDEKKVPMRTCIACRKKTDKEKLVRISCDKDKNILIDFKGTNPGRGAYLCDSDECLKKAIKTGALSRAFKCSVPEDVYRYLEEEIAEERNKSR